MAVATTMFFACGRGAERPDRSAERYKSDDGIDTQERALAERGDEGFSQRMRQQKVCADKCDGRRDDPAYAFHDQAFRSPLTTSRGGIGPFIKSG